MKWTWLSECNAHLPVDTALTTNVDYYQYNASELVSGLKFRENHNYDITFRM